LRNTFLAASSKLVLVSTFFAAARAMLSRNLIDQPARYRNCGQTG
jgi:hypothetical protein